MHKGCFISWPPPRSPRPMDDLAPEYHDLAEFYLEAARRLPIADIPYLADCISFSGLAVGLADPVTNIILTTINAFAKKPPFVLPGKPDDDALERTRKMTTFAVGARNSRKGLITFLMCYFRNLTQTQAKKFLDMAGHDLPLAVLLVETGRWGSQVPLLQPDAPRTKTALQEAAYRAGCSRTDDDLVRLMTWRYPRDLLDPVLDDLRGAKELSADCIYKICDLLRSSWPQPPPAPAPTPGTCWDISGNVTTIMKIRKGLFATTTISKDLVVSTTITSTCPINCTDDGVHLSTELDTKDRSSVVNSIVSSWRENPDFLPLLKMSLLDTIHGFYIDALGILPSHVLREGHLIRAILKAGHCYGPLDLVSNIILSSIWYDAIFPLSSNAVSRKIVAADILDARSMSRVESRSLDGLIAFVCHTYSVPEQHAVVLLCENRFNLSSIMLQGPNKVFFNFGAATLVAKHPQPDAFGDFLDSLTSGELDSLCALVSDKGQGYVLSDDTLNQLKMMVRMKTPERAAAAAIMAPKLTQSASWTLSERRSTFTSQQDYVRTRLQNLLLDYGNNEGHTYKLGVICGVTTNRYRGFRTSGTTCYHVNFLASTDAPNDATSRSYCSSRLFFAEFWNMASHEIEQSTNPPFCCPVGDSFDEYSIRCIVCDKTSCRIAHPSSGEYVYFTGNGQPGFPVHHQWGSDLGGMLESDFIYFDRKSDEFAKILSKESSSSTTEKQPRAREEEPALPERKTRARSFAGHLPGPF